MMRADALCRAPRALVWLSCLLLALVAVLPQARAACEPAACIPRDDPQEMLRIATDRLLALSREARAYAEDDPERYYAQVDRILEEVLDIRYFARGVMATYASPRLFRSLETDAEKQAFRDRIDRFETAIKRVFMVKYADALLTFEGERIDLVSMNSTRDDPDRASIRQDIHDKDGTTYRVQYSLRRDKSGGWLINNVIVEDVNLGQIYRSQFAEAVENNRGDVDYVVDHWTELMAPRKAGDDSATTGSSR